MGHSNPKRIEEPDKILGMNPSWAFYRCDKEGRWAFTKDRLRDVFWDKIFPKLKSFEQQTWGQIISGSNHHFIEVSTLNKCARDRLDQLNITEERIFSLRLENTIRIYGIRPKATMVVLWYDNDHGDNDTCVCRSHQGHT